VIVKAFTGGPLLTIAYLVYDKQGGHGAVIDAPLGTTKRIVNAIESARIKLLYVITTHGHWDHIADNAELTAATCATLCAHSWDMARMADPQIATEDDDYTLPVKPSRADHFVADGEVLEVGACRLQLLHCPGHTPGSICVYEREAGVLFTGDTLYRNGVGRTNFPGGNLEHLNRSLQKLAALPDRTRVYPGHGSPTTIKEERWLLELATLA
jgi:glyoxylase-like metal-dependent hydrolase (beta-lactamase superfamily II)